MPLQMLTVVKVVFGGGGGGLNKLVSLHSAIEVE